MNKLLVALCLPLMVFANHMVPVADAPVKGTISIVTIDGSMITMTDGTMYQVAPTDMEISSGWIGYAADVTITESNDPNYPLTLTNTSTKTSVNAKMMESGSAEASDSYDKDDSGDGED